MRIAVSACLLGINCKYNGKHNQRDELIQKLKGHDILPVCPETCAGLDCPRIPVELVVNKALDRDGNDLSANFESGAESVKNQILRFNPDLVLLKSKSPSCGKDLIYDGSFSGKLKEGNGILAQKLIDEGLSVISVD